MKLWKQILKTHRILLLILLFGTVIGLYQLANLPAEMWGDATAHYTLTEQVRQGKLFFDYQYGGDGPLYTYLVVALSWFFGLSFYTLKLTSVLVYLLFIIVMYLLANELFKKKGLAYITSFLTAVSFWSIVFARQPHARMLVPLFIATTLLCAIKNKSILSGIFLGIGMYTQASFWAMPLIFWRRFKIVSIGLTLTIPLVISFVTENTGFFTNQSYFGEKLATSDHLPFSVIFLNFLHNIIANFLSFYIRGDQGFRLNVPNSPHLDTASAIFFSFGFLLLSYHALKKKQTKYLEFIILPFFLIQIPSLLDIHNPLSQPNIGRMIGVIPFVYLSIAYGLVYIWQFVVDKTMTDIRIKTGLYYFCILATMLIIEIANIYKYFIIYPYFLPNHNTPFAKIIAQKMDTYPPSTPFIVIGSGWGEWQQPEQEAIRDSLKNPRVITFLPSDSTKNDPCSAIQATKEKTVIVTSPTDKAVTAKIKQCGKAKKDYLLQSNGFNVALVIEVNSIPIHNL